MSPEKKKDAIVLDRSTSAASPYPMSRLAPAFEPIDQANFMRDTERLLGAVTHGKLQVIIDQINHLKQEAKRIMEEASLNMELHKANCSFEKRVGQVYHLYERNREDLYFSLLSPNDWLGKPPHQFLGSYRLESDMTWTALEEEAVD